MPFKNFQAETEKAQVSQTFIDMQETLLIIQKYYPHLYKELNRDPQFEYDIEIYRKHAKFAKAYLRLLYKIINLYGTIEYSYIKKESHHTANLSVA